MDVWIKFGIFILFLGLLRKAFRKKNRNDSELPRYSKYGNHSYRIPTVVKTHSDAKKEIFPYKLNSKLLNSSELAFYHILRECLKDNYLIFSKVRIEDFINVKTNINLSHSEIFGLRNRIKSRHVDFLICEVHNSTPLLAIEVDGKSHKNDKVKVRDTFVNNVYDKVGITRVHVPVGSNFYNISHTILKMLDADKFHSNATSNY